MFCSDGNVYVLGGYSSISEDGSKQFTRSFEKLTDGVWHLLPEISRPRSEFRLASVGDRILVVGGRISGDDTDLVEMFNITTLSWNQTCSLLPSPRADFALATINVSDLETETIEQFFSFKDDVVLEKARRIFKPVSDHFSWTQGDPT